MMEGDSKGDCVGLPLSALRLFVPPVRMVSAAAWQTIQQRVAGDYGHLEEFVSSITDLVPELLTSRQRAQLILGLRARLILELCRCEATANFDIVQPHLDRIRSLIEAWLMEVGARNLEMHYDFVSLIKTILKDPGKRELFFERRFSEEFGPKFDEALHTLMWLFLSRLEKFLPLMSFQQVASMFVNASSVLHECMMSVSQCEDLKILLRYQKDLGQLDHNDVSVDDVCILSTLQLPLIARTEQTNPTQEDILEDVSWTPDLGRESLSLPQKLHQINTCTDGTGQLKTDTANWSLGSNGLSIVFGDTTKKDKSLRHSQSQAEDDSHLLRECFVQLQRLKMPLAPDIPPVRQNGGRKMKEILAEEKRGLWEETHRVSEKASSPDWAPTEDSGTFNKDLYMAPLTDCSDDDSWSYYSGETSHCKTPSSSLSSADSWSYYSDGGSSCMTPASRSTEADSLSNCSNEDPFYTGPENISDTSKKPGASKTRANTKKCTVQCFICADHVIPPLKKHMKTHFPTGIYNCPGCDSRFKLISSLKNHMKSRCYKYIQQQVDPERPDKAEKLYKCSECQEAFKYKVSLDKHQVTHNKLYCNVCMRVLRDAAMLARHKVSHTLYQCTRCEESFTHFLPLRRHLENTHKISRPFKCNHCSKTLPKLRVLILHEWKHTGHLPFQCAQCNLRLRSDAELLYHQRVHTKERPYLCTECGKTFSYNSNLMRHFSLVHGEFQNVKLHSCSQCEKSFKQKGALIKHQRSKHLHKLFRYPCPYCGKMMAANTLKRHQLMHTGQRPFKCTVADCDKFFRSASEVTRHILYHHTTDRPYKCDVCGKGFVRMSFLRVHAKIHSGEKPFVCHICSKAFPKLYSMQRHKNLVHTVI